MGIAKGELVLRGFRAGEDWEESEDPVQELHHRFEIALVGALFGWLWLG